MSLVRLLTSGKCLVGLKDSASHYRMRPKNLLPKFGSPKNPFAAQDELAPASAPTAPPAPVEPAATRMTPEENAAANLKETRGLPIVATAAKQPAGPVAPPKKVSQPGGWARRLIPFAWWSNRKSAPRLAGSMFHKSPVQGELSLDHVKVVRNDLSDADVELVPARRAAQAEARRGEDAVPAGPRTN